MNNLTSLMTLSGQAAMDSTGPNISRPTVSKAFDKSRNPTNRGRCCSRHFSRSFRETKVMPDVDLLGLKPACVSGRISLDMIDISRFKISLM